MLILLSVFLQACGQTGNRREDGKNYSSGNRKTKFSDTGKFINPEGKSIESRFNLPEGFKRIKAEENSFAYYLRHLPLKPHGSLVRYYDGKIKPNEDIYDAVVDLEIGNKDLHQCADAIMRLRAEYLRNLRQYEKIHFNFTNGFRADYSEWLAGNRIVVKGNKAYWKQTGNTSDSYDEFWKYLEIVFTYAGTLSLSKELKPVSDDDLQIGDIFIIGGSPGHAIIVVDAAVNDKTDEKIFLLAQSYMPAQELQVLRNNNDDSLSPWYSVKFSEILITPEWKFAKSDLKRFDD
ncbi:MAG TPA: DUF4846 domain-containing protein [Ignavibacteria bacterium]|nr:DUF4846 domain-containing protein [Ignavibacteria bacterium]